METRREMAKSVGNDQYGVDEITNRCMIIAGDHIDSCGYVKPDAPRAEGIPIEYCYGDGVVRTEPIMHLYCRRPENRWKEFSKWL